MPLKDTNCRNAKPQDKPYRLYDEQGLYLEVQPNGGRYWRLKYRFLGKEKRLALGVYPEVGLQEARRKRDDARVQLAGGQDPSLQRRMAKVVSQLDHQHTFESVAKQWLTIRESSWNPEYTRTVRQRLELNAFPWLGKLPISSISTQRSTSTRIPSTRASSSEMVLESRGSHNRHRVSSTSAPPP